MNFSHLTHRIIFTTLVVISSLLFYTSPTKAYVAITDSEDLDCIGRAMAYYMNVILHARASHGWQHIKVTTPVFGLGGGPEFEIFQSMERNFAQFKNVDAFAGNLYSTTCLYLEHGIPIPLTAMEHYTMSGFQGAFTNPAYSSGGKPKPVILTEFGDTCLSLYSKGSIESTISSFNSATTKTEKDKLYLQIVDQIQGRHNTLQNMREEFATITNQPEIHAINFFAANTVNPDWDQNHIYEKPFNFESATEALGWPVVFENEISLVTAGNKSITGINAANGVQGDYFYSQVANMELRWTVEIFNTYPALAEIEEKESFAANFASTINAAFSKDPRLNPILRPCFGDDCVFKSPHTLIEFLDYLDPHLTGDVWITAGPNEAALEHWLSDGCDNCQEYIIDPDTAPDPSIPVGCMAMKINPQILMSGEYESTCHGLDKVEVDVQNGSQYCVAGACQGIGSSAYWFTPTIIPLLKTSDLTVVGNRTTRNAVDYTSIFTHKDSNLPDFQQPATYRLNSRKTQFTETITYLKRLEECSANFNQAGCFLPKKIRNTNTNEKEFLQKLKSLGLNLYQLSFTPVPTSGPICDPSNDCRHLGLTYEHLLHQQGLLDVFNNIEPQIHALVPAYRVSSIDTISPQYAGGNVLEFFKNLIDRFKNERPTFQVDEFFVYSSSLSPLAITGLTGGIQGHSGPLSPKQVVDQHQEILSLDEEITEQDMDRYLKGPIIFNIQNTITTQPHNPLVPIVAAKINKDTPVCRETSKFESSYFSSAPSFAENPSGSLPEPAPRSPRGINFTGPAISLLQRLGVVTAPQNQTRIPAHIKHFTIVPTRHDQYNLDNIYSFMTSKYVQQKDALSKLSEPGPVQIATPNDSAGSSSRIISGDRSKLTLRLTPNKPIFALINQLTPKNLEKIPFTYSCFAKQVFGEITPGCEQATPGTTPTSSDPGSTAACTFSGGFNIDDPNLPPFLASVAQQHQVPIQVLLATLWVENCRTTTQYNGQTATICDTDGMPHNLKPNAEHLHTAYCGYPRAGTDTNHSKKSKGVFQFWHNIFKDDNCDKNGDDVCDCQDVAIDPNITTDWGRYRLNCGDNICSIHDSTHAAANYLSSIINKPAAEWTVEDMKKAVLGWIGPTGTSCSANFFSAAYCCVIDHLYYGYELPGSMEDGTCTADAYVHKLTKVETNCN